MADGGMLMIPDIAVRVAGHMWSEETSPEAEVISLAKQMAKVSDGHSNAVVTVALVSYLVSLVESTPEAIRSVTALSIVAGFLGLHNQSEPEEPDAEGVSDLSGLVPAGSA